MIDGCRFPLWGDYERPTFIYCCKKVHEKGASYCREHYELTCTKSTQHRVKVNFAPRKFTPLRRY